MANATVPIRASWRFDGKPQGQSRYLYDPKFQDFQKWTVQAASYGNQGSAEIVGSLAHAPLSDIITAARRCKLSTVLRLDTGSSTQLTDYLFGGFLDEIDADLGADEFTLHCRDDSSKLMEGTVESRTYLNTPVDQVVSQLTLAVNISPDVIVSTPQPVGYYFDSRSGLLERRSSAWDLIQKLATETENVAYCTPQGNFYFGPRERPGTKANTLQWSYDEPINDFIRLRVSAKPLRNSVFFVIVQGHTPHNGKNVLGTAAYVNDAIAADLGISAGIYEGLTLAQANARFGDDVLQVYNFNVEGMTGKGVQAIATSHALDIQGHEFVVTATCLGSSRFRIGDPVVVIGTNQASLDNRRFTITGLEHSFDVGPPGSRVGGFLTTLTLWASGVPVYAATGTKKKVPAPNPPVVLTPSPSAPPFDPYSNYNQMCHEEGANSQPNRDWLWQDHYYVVRD